MEVKLGTSASAEAAGTSDIVIMNSFKAAASWVQRKSKNVVAGYLLVDQAAVMNCGFSRMGRRKTGRCRRRHVGRPAAICD